MLTALHLESFKAIGRRQRIDLAPLTLLVGDDGAGKSAILQACLYLHHLLERGNANVERVDLGGNVMQLGGFAQLVHRHELTRAIVLRADLTTPQRLECFARAGARCPFPDLDDQIESAWLELTVRTRATPTAHGPIVDRVAIGVASSPEPLVWLETGALLHDDEPLYARINLEHPLLAPNAAEVAQAWASIAVPESALHQSNAPLERPTAAGLVPVPTFALARVRPSALPSFREPLCVLPMGQSPGAGPVAREVGTVLEMLVLGISAQLASSLRDILCLGSLRTIPSHDFLHESAGRATSWADGLAAWDRLLTNRSTLLHRTNHWLERLGMGCRVVVQPLQQAPSQPSPHHDGSPAARLLRLRTNTGSLVLPSEAGAGVSQLLPVIVAALEERAGLCVVELPELGLHPGIQVGLGDLFIEATKRQRGGCPLLVETHSEHMILRLLRRIRQTSAGELPEDASPFSPEELSVLHVEDHLDGLRFHRLRVSHDGDFRDPWPRGFFTERAAELL